MNIGLGLPTVIILMRLRQATFAEKRFIWLSFGGWKSQVCLAAPLVWTLVKSERQKMSQPWQAEVEGKGSLRGIQGSGQVSVTTLSRKGPREGGPLTSPCLFKCHAISIRHHYEKQICSLRSPGSKVWGHTDSQPAASSVHEKQQRGILRMLGRENEVAFYFQSVSLSV